MSQPVVVAKAPATTTARPRRPQLSVTPFPLGLVAGQVLFGPLAERTTMTPPQLAMAETIAPSDTSTSIVITPTGPQAEAGDVELRTHTDIAYSPLPLKLDLLAPAERKPLVLYLPGGGFVFSHKENALKFRQYLATAGFAVASIEYRTILHGATYEDGVADVRAAIQYLRSHADELGINADRIALVGESAGGYLAAMAGVTGVEGVCAVVDNFGGSDLSRIGDDFDPAMRAAYTDPGNPIARYVHGPTGTEPLRRDSAEVARANPVTYVDGTQPPFLFFHGDSDRLVSPSQTLLLHNALLEAGISSTRYVVAGGDHGDLAFLRKPESALLWSTVDVVDRVAEFLTDQLEPTS